MAKASQQHELLALLPADGQQKYPHPSRGLDKSDRAHREPPSLSWCQHPMGQPRSAPALSWDAPVPAEWCCRAGRMRRSPTMTISPVRMGQGTWGGFGDNLSTPKGRLGEARARLFTGGCAGRTRDNRQNLKYKRLRLEIMENLSAMKPVKQWKGWHREAVQSPWRLPWSDWTKPWATWSRAGQALGRRLD